MKALGKTTMCIALVISCIGCANTQNTDPGSSERVASLRTRNAVIAAAAAVVIGALIANAAKSSTKDLIGGTKQN